MKNNRVWEYMEKHKEEFYKKMLTEEKSQLEMIKNKQYIYVLSGPSGSGKHTIITEVLKGRANLLFIPSFTTRSPLPGESE